MKVITSGILALSCLGIAMTASANEVQLTSRQPTKVTFRIAHQNKNAQTVFGDIQSVELNKGKTISMQLDNYELTGLVIESVNGHELPPSVNQFNKPKQCSMTTDKKHPNGVLEFWTSDHTLNCKAIGGIFY